MSISISVTSSILSIISSVNLVSISGMRIISIVRTVIINTISMMFA